jgi:hypothetical protein
MFGRILSQIIVREPIVVLTFVVPACQWLGNGLALQHIYLKGVNALS